jgi:hypothetical protein
LARQRPEKDARGIEGAGGGFIGEKGEESRARYGGKHMGKGPVMLLTATRSSGGNFSMAESDGAAAHRAAEVLQRRACAARVCGVRRRLRVLRNRGCGAAAL